MCIFGVIIIKGCIKLKFPYGEKYGKKTVLVDQNVGRINSLPRAIYQKECMSLIKKNCDLSN